MGEGRLVFCMTARCPREKNADGDVGETAAEGVEDALVNAHDLLQNAREVYLLSDDDLVLDE